MSRQAKFRDADGWLWEAIERPREADVPTASDGPRTLFFLSRYQTRRRDDFPSDWDRRSADELLELLRTARPL